MVLAKSLKEATFLRLHTWSLKLIVIYYYYFGILKFKYLACFLQLFYHSNTHSIALLKTGLLGLSCNVMTAKPVTSECRSMLHEEFHDESVVYFGNKISAEGFCSSQHGSIVLSAALSVISTTSFPYHSYFRCFQTLGYFLHIDALHIYSHYLHLFLVYTFWIC